MLTKQSNQEQCCLDGILSILEKRYKKEGRFVDCCDQVEDVIDYIRQHLDISQPTPIQWTGGNEDDKVEDENKYDEIKGTAQLVSFPIEEDTDFINRKEIPRGSWHRSAKTLKNRSLAIDGHGNPLNLNQVNPNEVIIKGKLDVFLKMRRGSFKRAQTKFKEGDEFENINGTFKKSYTLDGVGLLRKTLIMKLLKEEKWDEITEYVVSIVKHIESVNTSIGRAPWESLSPEQKNYKENLKRFKDKFLPFMYALLHIDEKTFTKVVEYNKKVWGLEPGTQIAQPLKIGGSMVPRVPIPLEQADVMTHLSKKEIMDALIGSSDKVNNLAKQHPNHLKRILGLVESIKQHQFSHKKGLNAQLLLNQVEGKPHPDIWKYLLLLEQSPEWKKKSLELNELNKNNKRQFLSAVFRTRRQNLYENDPFSIKRWANALIESRPTSYKKAGEPDPQFSYNQLIDNKFNQWVEQLRKEFEEEVDDRFIVERPQHHAVFIGFGLVTQVGEGDWCRKKYSALTKLGHVASFFFAKDQTVAAHVCLDVTMLYDFVRRRSGPENDESADTIYPLYKVVYNNPRLIKSRLKRALEMATNPEWAYDVVGGNCQFWSSYITQGKPEMTQVCRKFKGTTVKEMELVVGFDDEGKYVNNLPKPPNCKNEPCIVKATTRQGQGCINKPIEKWKVLPKELGATRPVYLGSNKKEFGEISNDTLVCDIGNNVWKEAKKQYVCPSESNLFYPCLLGEEKINEFKRANLVDDLFDNRPTWYP